MKKRWISLLLMFAMLVAMVPQTATEAKAVQSGTCGDNLTWVLDDEGTLTISGTGAMTNYDYGDSPWYYNGSICSVVIEAGVVSIGDNAFPSCDSLTSVTIPSSVTYIGDESFWYCEKLTSVTIPNSVTYIGDEAFLSCDGLTSMTIPSSVISIGDEAFASCENLASVTISDSVTYIGDGAFRYCDKLIGIWVDANNPSYSSDDAGVLFDKDQTKLIQAPGAISGAYVIPSSVTSIGTSAFDSCVNLTSVTISDGVTYIGQNAFRSCENLVSVTIPNGVTDIAFEAFGYCDNLTSVTIPASVTDISSGAFCSCENLAGIWVDATNQFYSSDAAGVLFNKDRTRLIQAPGAISGAYVIPSSVTSINNGAFESCNSLTSVTIPNGVTSIGYYTFAWCDNLTSVTIPNSVTTIGDCAFRSCDSLTSVTIPSSVTSIGDCAFCSCDSLTSVTIPSSVTSIGDEAFWYCGSLTSVTIPDSVTFLGDGAFSDCSALIGIWVDANNPSYSSDAAGVLFNKDRSKLIQAPGAISGAYAIPNGVTSIGDAAFDSCLGLTGVTIPSSVISIGDDAFSWCCDLTNVTIPSSVTSIGDDAFSCCYDLTSVTIPSSVTSIGDYAFMYCDSLTDVYYTGTAAQWNAIDIGTGNECLTNATIHFESEMPTEPQYNSLWIDEHLRYASSEEYESQIVPGFTGRLDNVFSDIMDDTGIKAYNLLDALASFLNAQGDADESDLYQLILADILYRRTDENLMQEMYAQNLQNDTVEFLEILANSEEVVGAFTDSNNYQDLLDALDILKKVDIGSGDYSDAYTTFMNTLKGNVSMSNLKTSLSKNAKVTVLGIGLDLLFTDMEAMEDIMQYIINCMAYESTSEEFKEVLRALADKAETMSGEAYFPRLQDYDGEIDWEAMRDAINEFVDALDAYEQEGMVAIAEEAVRVNQEADVAFTQSAVKKVGVLLFDTLVGCVPVLNACNVVLKTAVCGGELLISVLTDVDDCAYALEMMARIYCFSVLMDSVADDYADRLTDDNYTAASLFDESIGVYRSVAYHGTEYGVVYVRAKLDDLYRSVSELKKRWDGPYYIEILLTDIQGYQNELEELVYQQEEIQSITCHNPYLDYSPEAEPIEYSITDSKLYIVACPVTMTISSEEYGQIAVLSDSESVIPEGLEHYFRVIETEPGSGEFMKVAIVPNGYEVILQGTGSGTMDAAVIEYHDGTLDGAELFWDIPVTEQSEGYFYEISDGSETDELVFDDTIHIGEPVGNPFTDVPSDSFYYAPVMWAVENNITNGLTDTTFGPDAACNRAQVVTFLWRAEGCPEPTATSHSFVDVQAGSFYEKAVLWAVENGITTGTDATHFSPNAVCNRATVVTFLHRAAGAPAVENANNPFSDVPANGWFTAPVLWAVEQGITNGLSATEFGPTANCNRAQVVTFLYRAYTD